LKNAARLINDGVLDKVVAQRYAGWDDELGGAIERGAMSFEKLEAYTLENGEPAVQSGRQELLENILNQYV
jgi:xylose isomerase